MKWLITTDKILPSRYIIKIDSNIKLSIDDNAYLQIKSFYQQINQRESEIELPQYQPNDLRLDFNNGVLLFNLSTEFYYIMFNNNTHNFAATDNNDFDQLLTQLCDLTNKIYYPNKFYTIIKHNNNVININISCNNKNFNLQHDLSLKYGKDINTFYLDCHQQQYAQFGDLRINPSFIFNDTLLGFNVNGKHFYLIKNSIIYNFTPADNNLLLQMLATVQYYLANF